jgi:hypothetical protein
MFTYFIYIYLMYICYSAVCVEQVCRYITFSEFLTHKRPDGGGGGAAKSSCRILGRRVGKKTLELGQKAVVFLWRKASLTRGSNYRNWEHKGHREIIYIEENQEINPISITTW